MTQDKLYELVLERYLEGPDEFKEMNRRAAMHGVITEPTQYEVSIIKSICKIILTNFTLTDLNARH